MACQGLRQLESTGNYCPRADILALEALTQVIVLLIYIPFLYYNHKTTATDVKTVGAEQGEPGAEGGGAGDADAERGTGPRCRQRRARRRAALLRHRHPPPRRPLR